MQTRLNGMVLIGLLALGTSACAGGTRGITDRGSARIWTGAAPMPAPSGVLGGEAIGQGRANPAPYVSGTLRRYQIRGHLYEPQEQLNYDEVGIASWYGPGFDGRPTATGERYDQDALTAAHKTLPLPALVEVTNLANGRQVILRVNDRGPFAEGRIIDLSRGAAEHLGLRTAGVGEVRVRYVGRAPVLGGAVNLQRADARAPGATPDSPRQMPRPTATGSASRGPYWVQAGAFSDPVMATRLAERLGQGAQVERAELRGQTLFRVRVGPWPDAGAAEQARQAVVARGVADALLMTAD